MEVFQGLFFTVAVSLFASFVLAKFLSFVSACEAEYKTLAAKTKSTTCEEPHSKRGSVGGVIENNRVGFIEEAVMVDECQDEGLVIFEVCKSTPIVKEVDGGEAFEVMESRNIDTNRESVGGGEMVETVIDKACKSTDVDLAHQVFDQIPKRKNSQELEGEDCYTSDKTDESMKIDEEDDRANKKEELLDEWEWEQIETSELESYFGDAVAFVDSKDNADQISALDNDVKMELCWLHKVATQLSCSEPQPMAFKVFARAKWNAWKRPENMTPEVAMEHYIALLSRCIPNWMGNDISELKRTVIKVEKDESIEVGDPNFISKEKE